MGSPQEGKIGCDSNAKAYLVPGRRELSAEAAPGPTAAFPSLWRCIWEPAALGYPARGSGFKGGPKQLQTLSFVWGSLLSALDSSLSCLPSLLALRWRKGAGTGISCWALQPGKSMAMPAGRPDFSAIWLLSCLDPSEPICGTSLWSGK